MNRLAIFALSLLLAACGQGQQATQTGKDGKPLKVYRHSMDGAPTNLDPVQSATIYSNFIVLNTYDTLYSYKYLARPYVLRPNLAAAMPQISDDGLTYTIKLKSGVEFIDDPAFADGQGREVTAADFVYSLKRHFDPSNRSQGAWLWQGRIVGMDAWAEAGADYDKPVEGLKALDKHTVQIKLTRPYPQLTYTLAMGFSGVVPREAVETYGRELAIRPVGSGPFRMDNFNTAKAVLVANEKFRAEPLDLAAEGFDPDKHAGLGLESLQGKAPPFVDRLEIDFISETAARWNSFNKGNEVQYSGVPVEQIDAVLDSRKPLKLKPEWEERYHWTAGLEAGFVYTAFNLDQPEIGYQDDPAENARHHALRCALRKAFDWEARNTRFYAGIGKPFPGVITPLSAEYNPQIDTTSIQRDIDGAKALLAAHDWTEETLPTLEYGFVNSVTSRQIFEQFRGFAADIGYPSSKIKPVSFATFGDYNKAIKTSQLDIIALGWGLDYPDAENTLQLFYGPNGTPGSNNSNFRDAEFDRLYEATAVMQPGPERTAMYRKMNQIVIDSCTSMGGLSRNRIYLWHKNVIGLPDREILGGFWLRYVDIATPDAPAN